MKTNRLVHEKSPYLLQHAHNPVDWYPWGEEAFEKSRAEGKPVFLSVGYSTCHWCHVMERESFENEAIAALLNEHFVPVKVDREERPDVDRIYMTFVQATTGSGGWPMSVFLTPDLKPFLGGTYFPPEDRWGRAGFPTVLRRVAEAWNADRDRIIAHGEEVIASLRETAEPSAGRPTPFNKRTLRNGWEQIAGQFDPEFGGFSHAPKFPRPVTLNFLLRFARREPESTAGRNALEMALFTLRKMAEGGMNDHLGGGLHRYSVDRLWHIPHFEKMLYDQAQLVTAYLDAFQITRDADFAATARGILDYVRRDMTAPGGGFYSAEDADSPLPENPDEKGEGAFYLWTQAEIDAALAPEDAALFSRFYGVEPAGNAPEGSDPHGEFTGKNTLIQRHTAEELAAALHRKPEEIESSLEASRRKLFFIRAGRPRPHLDDKIITAWNGLMISAFARAAQVLGDDYLADAERAAAFIRQDLWRGGRLLRSYRDGPGHVEGFADDYAFLIQGLLDLYEAGGDIDWLRWANELQQTMDTLFYDSDRGGYFSVTGDDASILLRLKEDYDGAEPSPNSIAALNALRLAAMLDDAALRERGEATLRAFPEQLARLPSAVPQLLVALDWALSKPVQIVLAGDAESIRPLRDEVHRHFLPARVLLFADGSAGQQWLAERAAFLQTLPARKGQAVAYVCRAFACQAPVTTAEALREVLVEGAKP